MAHLEQPQKQWLMRQAEKSELFRMPFTVGSYPNTFKSQRPWIAEAWHRTKTNSRHSKSNSRLPPDILRFAYCSANLWSAERGVSILTWLRNLSIFISQSMLIFTPLFEENINNDKYAQILPFHTVEPSKFNSEYYLKRQSSWRNSGTVVSTSSPESKRQPGLFWQWDHPKSKQKHSAWSSPLTLDSAEVEFHHEPFFTP